MAKRCGNRDVGPSGEHPPKSRTLLSRRHINSLLRHRPSVRRMTTIGAGKRADRKKRTKALKKATRANVERLAPRLAEMSYGGIMRIFHNAVRIIADPGKQALHVSAKRALSAINKEWANRARREPFPSDSSFKWPSTEAPGGDGRLDARGWLAEGLLAFMDYRVGRTNGTPALVRRALLSQIFMGNLPPVFPPDYLHSWGTPASSARLQELAETIAAFTRNAKRNQSADMSDAIHDWEDDLQFLYEEYYVHHFHFAWPSNEVI